MMNVFKFPFFEDIKIWQTSRAKKEKGTAKWIYERLSREYRPAVLVIWKAKARGIPEPRCLKATQQDPTTSKH